METLAYLHLALAYEAPSNTTHIFSLESLKLFEWLKRQKLVMHARIYLLSLVAILSILGMAGEALAQKVLRLGDSGPEVTFIQERLRQLGYFNQSPTRRFGSATRDAVIRFQRDTGLPADGIVGSQTESALFAEFGQRKGIATQDFSSRRRTDVLLRQDDRDRPLDVLRRGDRTPEVRQLQERLRREGYDPGRVDGVFGLRTERAVRQFQREKGLFPDGIAGRETLAALGLETDSPRNPYVVVVPVRDDNTLFQVQQYIPGATTTDSRRGVYVNAGEFPNRNAAESLSYLLRSQGLDARVAYFR